MSGSETGSSGLQRPARLQAVPGLAHVVHHQPWVREQQAADQRLTGEHLHIVAVRRHAAEVDERVRESNARVVELLFLGSTQLRSGKCPTWGRAHAVGVGEGNHNEDRHNR